MVWVYRYTYWDADSGERKLSSLYATFEACKNGLGIPDHSTAKSVRRRDLRDGGIFVPGEDILNKGAA